jgi:hypothetical protein
MFPRITDIWPNLLRRIRVGEEDEAQPGQERGQADGDQAGRLLQEEDESEEDGDDLRVDEGMLLEFFRHLYWTRLRTLGADQLEPSAKWLLGPDVVEECQAVANLEEAGIGQWAPLFEPSDFNNEHKPLTIQQYGLTAEELRAWAQRCVELRAAIVRKSQEHAVAEPEAEDENREARSR